MNHFMETRDEEKDRIATGHMVEASETGKQWTCQCNSCQYLRTAPGLVLALSIELNQPINDAIWINLEMQ